jgi:hypothetical protein
MHEVPTNIRERYQPDAIAKQDRLASGEPKQFTVLRELKPYAW